MAGQNNVYIPEEMLDALTRLAGAEGKTTDELITETIGSMLRIRSLRSFVAENRRMAEQQGLTEDDVPRLIDEYRHQQRSR